LQSERKLNKKRKNKRKKQNENIILIEKKNNQQKPKGLIVFLDQTEKLQQKIKVSF
jgi:hypothetical protein